MSTKSLARQIAIVLLGIVVPSAVLIQAYLSIASLSSNVSYTHTTNDLANTFINAKKSISDGNDYSLFSLKL